MPQPQRPISPHLQVYRWKLHMALSILHRITGIGLAAGLVLLVWWVSALATGREAYETFVACMVHPLGRLVLFGVTFALIFHALNGIRHLFWDTGQGFELTTVKRSGQAVVVLSVVLTLAAWALAYWQAGKI